MTPSPKTPEKRGDKLVDQLLESLATFGVTIAIRDWPSGSVLWTCESYSLSLPTCLLVSKDQNVFTMREGSRNRVYELPVGKWNSQIFGSDRWVFYTKDGTQDSSYPDWLTCVSFSPDGKSVIFGAEQIVKVESFSPRLLIKSIEFDPSREVCDVFYDQDQRPKAMVFRRDESTEWTELWDLLGGRCDWRIEGLRDSVVPHETSNEVWAGGPRADPQQLGFYSLADGHLLRNYPMMSDLHNYPYKLPCLSNDGCYFVYWLERPGSLRGALKRWDSVEWIREKLDQLEQSNPGLGSSHTLAMLNVQTGAKWFDFKLRHAQFATESDTAFIRENDYRLTTIDDDGVYDYDLPPRQRWFTPWAWASLAACMVLTWLMWPRRKRRASPQTSTQ
jgi:hypothetical protein